MKTLVRWYAMLITSITNHLRRSKLVKLEWMMFQVKAQKGESLVITDPDQRMCIHRWMLTNMDNRQMHSCLALVGNLQCNSSYKMLLKWARRNTQLKEVYMNNMIRQLSLVNLITLKQRQMFMVTRTLILKSYQKSKMKWSDHSHLKKFSLMIIIRTSCLETD